MINNMPQLNTTLCWHCSASYAPDAPKCPKCGATNANVDPDTAITEMESMPTHKQPGYAERRAEAAEYAEER